MDKNPDTKEQTAFARWFKRFGIVGFLFFLIKGLLWLIIPALAVYFAQ
jgi:hypothetical protein